MAQGGFDKFLGLLKEKYPTGLHRAHVVYALDQLCRKGQKTQKGFDPDKVNTFLLAICAHSERRPSPDPLRFGPGAAERFTKRDLKKYAKCTERLIDYIKKLKKTHLVVYLQVTGAIPADDVLSAPYLHHEGETAHIVHSLKGLFGIPMDLPETDTYIEELGQRLATVVALPDLRERYNRGFSPLGDYLLFGLCRYVYETTGAWNDALLVEILDAFKVPHTESTEALRVWRNRTLHPRVTRKRSKRT